jgi:hypothetical protein
MSQTIHSTGSHDYAPWHTTRSGGGWLGSFNHAVVVMLMRATVPNTVDVCVVFFFFRGPPTTQPGISCGVAPKTVGSIPAQRVSSPTGTAKEPIRLAIPSVPSHPHLPAAAPVSVRPSYRRMP